MVFKKRPIHYSDFAIPVNLEANENRTIFIGLDKMGESLQFKAEVLDEEKMKRRVDFKMLTSGLMIGWMILIVFIVMVIWVYLKEIANLYYSLYIITITGWILSNTGIGFQLLWPFFYEFNNIARPLFLLLAATFFALTLLSYFKKNSSTKTIRKILKFQLPVILMMIITLLTVDVNTIQTNLKVKFLILVPVLIGVFVLTAFVFIFLHWKNAVKFSNNYFWGMLFFLFISLCQNIFQFGLSHPILEFINTHGASISLIGETSIIAAGFVFKFNEFKKEKELMQLEMLTQQFSLSKEIINIQELERQRIGQDLHDSIGGLLATLKLYLDKATQDAVNVYLNKCKQILEQCVHEVRVVIDNLVPQNIHLHGFCKAFELFISYHRGSTEANIIFYHQLDSTLNISSQTVLYRILTELLNNSIKHAKATEININIIEDASEIRILFEDNGIGFNPLKENNGHGLKSISNRVKFLDGSMHTESSHQGTTIIIQIPVRHHLSLKA